MGIGVGRARRLSLGAAITFAVAAVADVIGNRVTGRINLALGVFAELVVAGMLLSYWLDRTTRASDSADSGGGQGSLVSDLGSVRQNIIASGPGAIAQGAVGGNIINHGSVEAPGRGESAAPDPSEEREG